MYNWTVDKEKFKREGDAEAYEIWRLEQLINFGLNDQKISASELKKHWEQLRIDPARKRFLQILLDES
ncbi:MAG: hypothetical protein D6687_01975 [Acidobacteria bacterium]|jgi:hypothetical protein|nr:MAG: hypothetical protein D6687_01975 [Acidobacteriota bacterium]GIU81863.1 MAG: hypothetical protein KatS3mg006_0927 [Pyrinomonadaceae bacterium]